MNLQVLALTLQNQDLCGPCLPRPSALTLGLWASKRRNRVCPCGGRVPTTSPTSGGTPRVEFSMPHKCPQGGSADLWFAVPPAHEQLLIGTACSVSALG